MPEGTVGEPPEWLSESQKKGWRLAIQSVPDGLLKTIDASIFTIWVIAEDLHRDAAEKVAQYGTVIKSPGTQTPIQSPYLSVLNKQAQIMMRAAAEMGFTPSSRSRVKIDKPKGRTGGFGGLKEIP